MRKVGLSVYSLSVSRGGTEKKDLNNICEGKSIIDIFYEFIEQNSDKYIKDTKKESLFGFSQKYKKEIYDANDRLICTVLCGIIKTGEYGTSSELVDINTGDIYNRSTEQADIMPFGFCIIVPAGKIYTCNIVLQTLGKFGVKLLFQKNIQKAIRKEDSDLFISMGPVIPKQYIQKYLEEGLLQKITMIRYEIPEDESERLGINYGVRETREERIIHKPIGFIERKRKAIEEWINGQRSATEIIQIEGFEYDNLKFVFKLGDNNKTISLDNIDKIVITEDITDKVQIVDGHPTFDSLKPIMIETGRDYLVKEGFISE